MLGALADFGHDAHSSDSLRGSWNCFSFGHVNNTWFPVRTILRHLNTTTLIGEVVKTFWMVFVTMWPRPLGQCMPSDFYIVCVIWVPSLAVIIAQAIFLLERGQSDTQVDRRDWTHWIISTQYRQTALLASISAMKESSGSSLESLDESTSSFWLAVAAFIRSRVGLPGAGWYSRSANVFGSSSSSSKYLKNQQTTHKHLALTRRGKMGRSMEFISSKPHDGSQYLGDPNSSLNPGRKLLQWFCTVCAVSMHLANDAVPMFCPFRWIVLNYYILPCHQNDTSVTWWMSHTEAHASLCTLPAGHLPANCSLHWMVGGALSETAAMVSLSTVHRLSLLSQQSCRLRVGSGTLSPTGLHSACVHVTRGYSLRIYRFDVDPAIVKLYTY